MKDFILVLIYVLKGGFERIYEIFYFRVDLFVKRGFEKIYERFLLDF